MSQKPDTRTKITIAEEDIGKLTDLKLSLRQVHEMKKQVFPGLQSAKLFATQTAHYTLTDDQLTKVLDLLEADIKSSIAALISAP